MARKKRTRKNTKFKRTVRYDKRKFNLAWKSFLFWLILSILSLVLYKVSSNPLWVNLFGILWIVLGFIAVAFLIVVLIFLFMKGFRK